MPASPSPSRHGDEDAPAPGRDRIAIAVWAGICLVAVVVLERRLTPRTFFFDEWNFVLLRRTGPIADVLLQPHNGHLSAVPVALYRLMMAVFGLDHYRPYRLAGLLAHVGVATVTFAYVRRRLDVVSALAAGTVVLFLGSGWQNIFWPFQIGYLGSLALGILAWLLLERGRSRSDVAASVALCLAVACSGVGIPLVAGAVAALAVRREWDRVLRVTLAPVALYLVWYLPYGTSDGSSSSSLRTVADFTADAAAGAVAGLAGRDLSWGRIALAGLIVLCFVAALTGRASRWTIAPATAAAAYWGLTAYSRASFGEPIASRYVYVGAVLVLLVAADLGRVAKSCWTPAVAIVLAMLCVWGNWKVLYDGSGAIREDSAITRSELRALEWAAETVAPDYHPDLRLMPQVVAAGYFAAIDELGSPAAGDGEVFAAKDVTRREVDRVSLEALGFPETPPAPPAGAVEHDPALTSATSPIEQTPGSCAVVAVDADGLASAELSLQSEETNVISAAASPVEIRMRRVADDFRETADATVPADESFPLFVRADHAPTQQWIAELRSPTPIEVCGIG